MESKKSNKITDIVRLRQMIKKWKKLAVGSTSKTSASAAPTAGGGGGGGSKSIKFLKRKLSFSESNYSSSSSSGYSTSSSVPKGYLAVSVGVEQRRFVIPTEYLAHGAFAALLKEAEEEFGFGQEGVLRIPCEVGLFQGILKVVEKNKDCRCHLWYCSPEAEIPGGARQLPPKPVCR
ncbi:auxin-responsive protein SAUR65-like [Zingiber officinale]|uniref:auxin-responsive protein SAUR65-like n=1 Tax=Zingiber officinale TaxID=94328 RepID=UPI001C4DC830|nr:auxin-responsive protein SAUR65-like [Zingiber officinale]